VELDYTSRSPLLPACIVLDPIVQSEALINILDRKGIVSKQELLEEMKKVQAAMVKSKA